MSALRKVEFTHRFAVETVDGATSSSEQGDLSDLLHAADPYLFSGGAAPCLDILNAFFASGGADHGAYGGAEWCPFTITADEFDALLAEAKSMSIPVLTRTQFLHFIGMQVPPRVPEDRLAAQ